MKYCREVGALRSWSRRTSLCSITQEGGTIIFFSLEKFLQNGRVRLRISKEAWALQQIWRKEKHKQKFVSLQCKMKLWDLKIRMDKSKWALTFEITVGTLNIFLDCYILLNNRGQTCSLIFSVKKYLWSHG